MPAAPPPIVPSPAASFAQLRGRRVIVGVPGLGFRSDLRADDPVVQGSRTYVPTLTEQDYYRAEIEQLEVFAPLVPVERVWVEVVQHAPTVDIPRVTLDMPPVQVPVPAQLAGHITGRRIVQSVPDGYVRDLRAVTGIYVSDRGKPSVRVCGEADWYRWATGGLFPSTHEIAADLAWTE